jgi:peroxiredoxin family protein
VEEKEIIEAGTPTTIYSTNWSLKIFKEWQGNRANTEPMQESTALNFGDKSQLQNLNHDLE